MKESKMEERSRLLPTNETAEDKYQNYTSSTEVQASGGYEPQKSQFITTEDDTIQNLKVGNISSLMHLVKGNVGTGILAMPNAVNNAGLWFGGVGIMVIGGIAVHCMHLLLNCSHILRNRVNENTLDYASTLETALKTGPEKFQRWSGVGRTVVNVFLMLTQMGFCCIYHLFVAQNIKYVVDSFYPDALSTTAYIAIVTAVLIPYTWIPNLKYLAPFSTLANILNFVGMVIIFQHLFQGIPNTSERPSIRPVNKMPLYFGTVIFSYEGIGLVMPIENKMKYPQDFGGLSGVMNLGMTIVTVLYTSMGFYGYLKFGEAAKGSITLNMPEKNWLYLSVNLIFAVSLFISYGLMFYVPMRITWPWFSAKITSRKFKKVGEYLYRLFLVLLTFGVASVVPKLDLLISLVGAFASCSLALMIPPIIDILTLSVEEGHFSLWRIIKDILIVLFGFIGFVTGTYSSLQEIIDSF